MAVKNIIGNKNIFAIEYEIESTLPNIMGKACIWIDGNYIGAYDDSHILTGTLYHLERISPTSVNGEQFNGMNSENVYEVIKNHKDGYFLNLGESFDDFSVIVYFSEGKFNFIWELLDAPFYNYPGYPEGLLSSRVSESYYTEVLKKLKKELMILKA